MEKKSTEKNAKPPHDPEARKKVLRRALRNGLLIWPIATVLYWMLPLPVTAPWAQKTPAPALDMVAVIPALAFPAFALALIASILSLNVLPARTLFHPTRARILGAVGLWMCVPINKFFFFP